MNKIGKNKAPSYDGMIDTLFQKSYYDKIKINTAFRSLLLRFRAREGAAKVAKIV